MPLRVPLVLALVALVLTGCGEIVGGGPNADRPAGTTTPAASTSAATGGVLYDGEWVLQEGTWFLADGETFPEPASDGLITDDSPGGLWISTPALYGKLRVRIEESASEPATPAWCEDVVEVSLAVRSGGLVMGGFEEFSEPMPLAPATYRVRYCVSGLDAAERETAEDELDGDDYRLYTGQHLFQLWPAPAAPRRVVRLGSAWARANQST